MTHIVPSGWEIINDRLNDTGTGSKSKADYVDIRDDRVLTYFDLRRNEKKTFELTLNASYEGRYYLPAIQVEAMYDNSISANTSGKWITVKREE